MIKLSLSIDVWLQLKVIIKFLNVLNIMLQPQELYTHSHKNALFFLF